MATPLPIPRTESGSTVHDGRFYIMGGIGAWEETLNSFSSYDPVSALRSGNGIQPRVSRGRDQESTTRNSKTGKPLV